MKKFRVLSLDGGGIRGLYSACFLKNLVARFDIKYNSPKHQAPDIGKAFNLICGTSTGAILTCALAVGIPIDHIISLYVEHGPKIFPKPMPTGLKLYGWIFKHCKRNPGQKHILEQKLKQCFKDRNIQWLYDQRQIDICVPAINALTYKPWIFKTPHCTGKHRDNNTSLVDVCLASAAAPIFFPLHEINFDIYSGIFIDGGLYANNPALIGLIEALELTDNDDEIEIISLSTSDVPWGNNGKKNLRRGILGWRGGIDIGIVSMTAQANGVDFTVMHLCRQLRRIGRKITYYRFKELPRGADDYKVLALDNASPEALRRLMQLAADDADYNHHLIKDCIEKKCEDTHEAMMVQNIFSNMTSIDNIPDL